MTPTIEDVLKNKLNNNGGYDFHEFVRDYTKTYSLIIEAIQEWGLFEFEKGVEFGCKQSEYASLNRQGWTRDELKIYFENNFDCYGDAQGDVVLAMTFEAFEKSFQHWMPLPNKPEPI